MLAFDLIRQRGPKRGESPHYLFTNNIGFVVEEFDERKELIWAGHENTLIW
jgi:hypothetical protein